MESWRQELYNTLSHSVEGSSWKDHKYVAIVNGKYIYPEDLKKEKGIYATTGKINGASKTVKTSSGASSTKSSAESNRQTTAVNPSDIKYTDKGKVKSYRALPKDPEIGDVYYLEDTKQKVYWNGEIWTPYSEKKTVSKSETGGYVGGGDTGTVSDYGLNPETISRLRSILSRRFAKTNNVRGFGGGR